MAACSHYDVMCAVLDYMTADASDVCPVLCLAARRGDAEIVDLLMDHGADVNLCDSDRNTPLHCAAAAGRAVKTGAQWRHVVQAVLAATPDVNARDTQGRTALCIACSESCSKSAAPVVKLLLEAGADPDLPPGDALSLAASNSNAEVVQLLVEYGAQTDCRDGNQRTALHSLLLNCASQLSQSAVKCLPADSIPTHRPSPAACQHCVSSVVSALTSTQLMMTTIRRCILPLTENYWLSGQVSAD